MRKILFLFIITTSLTAHGGILNFASYHTPAQVQSALQLLHSTYPGFTQLVSIGNSVEGRAIMALKISSTPTINDPSKGDVVFVGLHHAREWMSVEVALYIADELLAQYAAGAQIQLDLDRLQVWIIPVVNPDGFEWTLNNYRYWRKNRRNNLNGTFGVDLNRNWSYQWGTSSGDPNGSPNPIDDTFFGAYAFSEPETLNLRNFLDARTNLKCFVTYHSYSELYLRPWSYSTTDPPGEQTLQSIVQRNINRIAAVSGHTYSPSIWYTSTGEATDFSWQEKRIASFTPELRPTPALGSGNGGLAGFSPPASEILPTCQENLSAAIALIHDAARPGVWIRDNAGDTGSEPSSGYTWESPDIWTVPAVLNQGATVDLHVRVNNNTGAVAQNVTVEAYYTDPRITLEFPSLSSNLINTTTVNVPPGGKDVVFQWTTPVGTNIWGERHWCVGAVVKHENDMPLTTVVRRSSNIACHNFNTTEIVSGSQIFVAATNFLNVAAELSIQINREEIPSDWKLIVPAAQELQQQLRTTAASYRKSRLLKTTGIILEPGETVKIPIKVTFEKIPPNPVLLRIGGELIPLIGGKREPLGNGYTYSVIAKER